MFTGFAAAQLKGSCCLACAHCLSQEACALQGRLHMVIGRAIEVPRREAPTKEEVQQYLRKFIEELQALFERHKATAGYPDLTLQVL